MRYTQMVLVFSRKKSRAWFVLLEKKKKHWKIKMQCPAYIGRNGMGKQYEGDGKTPVGLYHLTEAFGRKKNPGTVLSYTKLTPYHYWCTDVKSKDYNRMVKWTPRGQNKKYNRIATFSKRNRKSNGMVTSGEQLYQYKKQYRYALCIDYNKDRIRGRGSAIFLHCMGNEKCTEGCVAISCHNMKRLLKYAAGKIPIFLL